MNILVNGSNLKQGGGIQVADSFCRSLELFPEHHFIVVLAPELRGTLGAISSFHNTECYEYSVSNRNIIDIALLRDRFLDSLVRQENIDRVISIFGPIYWRPACPHLVGFARAQILPSSFPYRKLMPITARLKEMLKNLLVKHYFMRTSDAYYTETEYVSEKIRTIFKTDEVITATNTYNQVFVQDALQQPFSLPTFQGTTILTLSSAYRHKNLEIIPKVAEVLKREHPDLNFRFVITVNPEDLGRMQDNITNHIVCIGKVDISQCPSIYRQCDIVFQPSLLECFSATYPEAMVSERAIVTTDLEFAHNLCGNAALYYEPLKADSAAQAILRLIQDSGLYRELVDNGKKQLEQYDNYHTRTVKLIEYAVNMKSSKNQE